MRSERSCLAWGPVRQKPGGTKWRTASAEKAQPEKKLPWIEVTSILLCHDSFIWKQVLLPWHPQEQFGWYLSNFLHCLGHAVFYSIVFFQQILQKSVLHWAGIAPVHQSPIALGMQEFRTQPAAWHLLYLDMANVTLGSTTWDNIVYFYYSWLHLIVVINSCSPHAQSKCSLRYDQIMERWTFSMR